MSEEAVLPEVVDLGNGVLGVRGDLPPVEDVEPEAVSPGVAAESEG